MEPLLFFLVLIPSVLLIIGYIAACKGIAGFAHKKGHAQVNGIMCFFLGIPYMIYVMSLPDLSMRRGTGDYVQSANYNNISNSKSINPIPVIAAVVLLFGGILGFPAIMAQIEEKNIELVETEYRQAFDNVKSDIMSSESCIDADITSMYCTVIDVKKSDSDKNTYIATLRVDCNSSRSKYSSGWRNEYLRELENILVSFEVFKTVPTDLKLSNRKKATFFDNSGGNSVFQIYVYVDGDLSYYPGFKYSG